MTTQSLSAAIEYVAENGGTYSKNGKLYVCTAAVDVEAVEGDDEPIDFYNEDMEGEMSLTEAVKADFAVAFGEQSSNMIQTILNLLGVEEIEELADLNLVTVHDLADYLASKGVVNLAEIGRSFQLETEEENLERIPIPLYVAEPLTELDAVAEVDTDAPADDLTELDAAAKVGTWDETEIPNDDLTAIKGIGPATSAKLKAIGFHNFKQLADLSPEQCETLNEELNVIGNKAQAWSEFAASLIK